MRLKFNFAKVAASNSLIGLWGIFGMSASIYVRSPLLGSNESVHGAVFINVQCTLLLVTTEFIAELISVGNYLEILLYSGMQKNNTAKNVKI